MRLLKFAIILCLLLVVAALGYMYQFPKDLPTKPMQCQRVLGEIGVEDIVVNQRTGVAYLPSQDRRADQEPTGIVYSLDLNNHATLPVKMSRTLPMQFHPLGAYLYEEGGQQYLYVVNFGSKIARSIELFRIDGNTLTYLRSFTDPRMISPNAIFVLSLNDFYVTNYIKHNVLHYKNGRWDIAVDHIPFANGINGDLNKHELLIVSTMNREMYLYHYDPQDGHLTYLRNYPLQMFGDDIRRDVGGNYWVTGHPNSLLFLLHSMTPLVSSPSYVVKLDRDGNKVTPIFYDSGAFLSGSSVAVPYRDKLLIGTVFEPFILECAYHHS